MKSEEYHMKQLVKWTNRLREQNHVAGLRDVCIRGDSKARCLLPFLHEDPYLNIVSRPGADIHNKFLRKQTITRIKRAYKPVVIIWLGTCELTVKRGKFIRLVDNVEKRLLEIELDYSYYKEELIRENIDSTIIYLECPFFSIVEWNRKRGHYAPETFSDEQIRLEKGIKQLNIILKGINGLIRTP